MIRIGNSSLAPEVALRSAVGGAAPALEDASSPQTSDEVQLSHAVAALEEQRSNRIAELKKQVASPDYLPPSLPVSRRLVSAALSRPE